jgi:acyl-CoA oxidase
LSARKEADARSPLLGPQHDCLAMRKDLRAFLKDDLFVGRYHDSLEDMRNLALKRVRDSPADRPSNPRGPGRRLKKLCEKPGRFVSVRDFETDPRRIFAAHEITCQVDGSFATKLTVQFNLFGGTVLKLGTERHHHILDKIDAVQEVGCFALTELGYGNNAVGLRAQRGPARRRCS